MSKTVTPTGEVHPAANLFPMIEGDELDALVDSIREHGLAEAIWLTPDGLLLDGRNRLAACAKAAVTPRYRVYEGSDLVDFIIRVNLHRRHLTVGQRSFAALEVVPLYAVEAEQRMNAGVATDPEATLPQGSKKRAPQATDKAAEKFGVSGRSVRGAQRIRQEAPDLEDKIKRNDITIGEAEKELRKRKAKERFIAAHADWDAKANTKGERWEMLNGDFRDVLQDIEPGSVDAIITDPPYPDEFLPLWRDLAEVAVRLLRPGAPLITWSGQLRLPQVLDGLCGPLTYQWIVCLDLPGINSRVPLTKMIQTWKPIIIATNGKWAVPTWQQDRVVSPTKEQALYEWQQNSQPAVEMIERYVSPGGLILDPFAGVGSFGVAAMETGRRFLGVELDDDRYSQATQRIYEHLNK